MPPDKSRRRSKTLAPGDRVAVPRAYQHCPRATVKERIVAKEIPVLPYSTWKGGGTLVRVELDFGLECFAAPRALRLLDRDDVYEHAWSDPAGFYDRLLEAPPLARAEMLAHVVSNAGG